ncbi:MAG: amidophosphoribosyltransferase [Bdellovibrionales bacterium]|nr:amidophosphoribosyltransferase [Bdellovibrionales bacterium]
MKAWHDECAVFGIWNDPEAGRMAYLGLYAQQHRGQESAGIVTLDRGAHISRKGLGLVGKIFTEDYLEALRGNSGVGHVRYSTTGNNQIFNIQPLTAQLRKGPLAIAHNGNIVNSAPLREELIASGSIFQGTSDTEVLMHLVAKSKANCIIESLKESALKLEGAYSMVIQTGKKLIAMRDPMGFRPLVLGRRKNDQGEMSVVFASETCAFDLIGAKYEREIEPGEIFWVDEDGEHSERFSPNVPLARCVFEHVYFSRPDSFVFSQSVYEARKKMGRQLAIENPVEADIVVPVPDSGVPAAIGYSQESGIPFELGIIRNHYIGRTFIQPSQSIRSFGVKIKLNPHAEILRGKRIVVIDDSLVRGTTSKKIIALVRQAGAKEVHFKLASPPTTGACFYGVDTPKRQQLIAAQKSIEEIRQFVDADTLSYLSVEGLMEAVGKDSKGYCAACFDGKYPTRLYNLDK